MYFRHLDVKYIRCHCPQCSYACSLPFSLTPDIVLIGLLIQGHALVQGVFATSSGSELIIYTLREPPHVNITVAGDVNLHANGTVEMSSSSSINASGCVIL